MKHQTIAAAVTTAACVILPCATAMAVVTFETPSLPPAGFWNGSDGSGGFTADGATFHNNYDSQFGSWSGFAVSNHTNTATQGWSNQYSAITGSGVGGSAQYAVGYYSTYDPVSTQINFASLTNLAGKGAYLSNTTWGALEVLNGGGFGAKKFGGASGDDPDWFKLTIEGFAGVNSTGVVEFFLADFRFSDKSQDYVVQDWRFVDFSALGTVDRIAFRMSSSDNGAFGMNTPSYFAMDNFMAVPEPSSAVAALLGAALLIRRKRCTAG
jgi:hypothetical protein